MESRFQSDFSRVRLHTDAPARRSARTLGARAYTVGREVVFGEDQYSPATPAGRKLLAHELTHVEQQGSSVQPGDKLIGPVDGADEREALFAEEHLASDPVPSRQENRYRPGSLVPGRTIQRSLLGGIVGGLAGAAGGALIGGALGGPIGAVIGGVAGLIGGALVGDTATTRRRSLTSADTAYAREIFQDSLDYSRITITRGSMFASASAVTIGNTIHLTDNYGGPVFVGDSLNLTRTGRELLIHEMGHVWQYQNGGLAYIPLSLVAQLRAVVSTGHRAAAYRWQEPHAAGIPWDRWNPEQQARAIEEYNTRLRRQREGAATLDDLRMLSILLPYMARVRTRQGAPTLIPRSSGAGSRPAASAEGAGP